MYVEPRPRRSGRPPGWAAPATARRRRRPTAYVRRKSSGSIELPMTDADLLGRRPDVGEDRPAGRRCRVPSGSVRQVDVDAAGEGERHDERRRREVARPGQRMDPALEVAVARQDRGHDEVVGLDRRGDRRRRADPSCRCTSCSRSRPGRSRALERLHEPGGLEIAGDRLRAGRERGLDGRWDPSPRATAFRASRPAPTMTVGFDVFVHEVIAAIATDPVRIVAAPSTSSAIAGRPPSTATRPRRRVGRPVGSPRHAGTNAGGSSPGTTRPTRPPRAVAGTRTSPPGRRGPRAPGRSSGSCPQAASGTRSCGRRGPATDGSTVARSSSSSSSKSGPAPAPATGPAPRIPLDQVDRSAERPGQAEVGERLVVDREERRRRPELGAHVADRRPVGEGQAGEAVAGELDERADDTVGRAASRSRRGRGRSRSSRWAARRGAGRRRSAASAGRAAGRAARPRPRSHRRRSRGRPGR